MKIYLVGFMGSGKTTVGACLAEMLGWNFVDLDREIAAREGSSIAELFRTYGEARFRQMETSLLEQVFLEKSTPGVIALGGGTFVQPQNRELLRREDTRTVYLYAEFSILLERCSAEPGTRPLMADLDYFRRLHEERQPLYRTAELVVEIGQRTPPQIAEEIAHELSKWNVQAAVSE